MKLFQLEEGVFINPAQICSVHLSVKGAKCGASFDQQQDNFIVIRLSNGENIIALHDTALAGKVSSMILQLSEV